MLALRLIKIHWDLFEDCASLILCTDPTFVHMKNHMATIVKANNKVVSTKKYTLCGDFDRAFAMYYNKATL